MRYSEIVENGGRIVKGVNTTADVGVDEIRKQARKFGNRVTKDGIPPLIYEGQEATYWVGRIVKTFNDTPQEINNGWCWGFANRLAKKLPGSKVVSTTGDTGQFPGHSAVLYRDRYYDAETPEGAETLAGLNYCKRMRAFVDDPGIEDSRDGLMFGKRKA